MKNRILILILFIVLSSNVYSAKAKPLAVKKISSKEYELGKAAYTIKKLKIDGTECVILVGKYQTTPALSCDW